MTAHPATIAARVETLIRHSLGIAPGLPCPVDARLADDLGADNLDAVAIEVDLEHQFGMRVPDDAITAETTVGDVIALVERFVAAAPHPLCECHGRRADRCPARVPPAPEGR